MLEFKNNVLFVPSGRSPQMVISPILVAVQIFFGPGGHWMSEGKRPNLGSLEGEKKKAFVLVIPRAFEQSRTREGGSERAGLSFVVVGLSPGKVTADLRVLG